jgi:hypothetical protein
MSGSLTCAETQMLVANAVLDSRGTPADDAALDAAGSDYFGMYRVDWSGAEESLIWRDLITRDGETLKLTDDGAPVAERCQADHQRYLFFYNEHFTRARPARRTQGFAHWSMAAICVSTA